MTEGAAAAIAEARRQSQAGGATGLAQTSMAFCTLLFPFLHSPRHLQRAVGKAARPSVPPLQLSTSIFAFATGRWGMPEGLQSCARAGRAQQRQFQLPFRSVHAQGPTNPLAGQGRSQLFRLPSDSDAVGHWGSEQRCHHLPFPGVPWTGRCSRGMQQGTCREALAFHSFPLWGAKQRGAGEEWEVGFHGPREVPRSKELMRHWRLRNTLEMPS